MNTTPSFTDTLRQRWQAADSMLCVGLDPDPARIPAHLGTGPEAIDRFCRDIIAATADTVCAFKPQIAYFAAQGAEDVLAGLIAHIHAKHPGIPVILDAKRGDIGNTSDMYARSFFEHLKVDALTIAPYMGSDSVQPFLKYTGHWVVLLALTSNEGAFDFQLTEDKEGKALFEQVLEKSKEWGDSEQLMYVVGATKAAMLERVRAIVPDSFLLVPGVGSQNGSLEEVARYGLNEQCGLLVNASRSIIYADHTEAFASAAAAEAEKLRHQMAEILIKNKLVEA